MASVQFLTAVGGDNSVVSDDADGSTGLKKGGHRTRFVPALAQIVAIAQFVVAKATEAANFAAAALGGAGSTGTSTSNVSMVATGATFTLTTQTGKNFMPGQKIGAVRTSAPTTVWAYGTVQSYNSANGQLVIATEATSGAAGPFANWSIGLSLYGVSAARAVNTSGLATGGGNLSADRTINVPAAAASDVLAGSDAAKAVTSAALRGARAPVKVSVNGAFTPNFANGDDHIFTLGGASTMNVPTGMWEGQSGYIYFIQDATGSRTLALNALINTPGNAVPVLSTAANAVDRCSYVVRNISGTLTLELTDLEVAFG